MRDYLSDFENLKEGLDYVTGGPSKTLRLFYFSSLLHLNYEDVRG